MTIEYVHGGERIIEYNYATPVGLIDFTPEIGDRLFFHLTPVVVCDFVGDLVVVYSDEKKQLISVFPKHLSVKSNITVNVNNISYKVTAESLAKIMELVNE